MQAAWGGAGDAPGACPCVAGAAGRGRGRGRAPCTMNHAVLCCDDMVQYGRWPELDWLQPDEDDGGRGLRMLWPNRLIHPRPQHAGARGRALNTDVRAGWDEKDAHPAPRNVRHSGTGRPDVRTCTAMRFCGLLPT